MLIVTVVIAIAVVAAVSFFAPQLPFNELCGGYFYQIVSVAAALGVSALLNKPMIYMARGNSAYKKGKFKQAVGMYKKAFETKRLSPDMEIYCGYICLKEGEREKCEEIFERVSNRKLTQRQKDSFDTNRALLLWKQDKIDEAVALLQNVWDRAQSVTVAGSLGALMLVNANERGNYDEIVDFCEMTNEKFTYERTILANLGEAYYMTGRNADALEAFAQLMDCGTSAPAPFYYYALALLKDGQIEKAMQMLENALGCRFSALSTVTKKAVKAKLAELES